MAIAAACLGFALSLDAAEFHGGDSVALRGTHSDNLFATGKTVDADFDSTDDVYIAGGEIQFRGRTRENLVLAGGELTLHQAKARLGAVAGGEISVTRGAFRELIAGGGTIRIENTVIEDDLVLGGGEASVDAGTRISGSMVLAGGEVHFAGTVGGDARVSGGEVTLSGRFGGSVRVQAERLRIAPQTVIEGDLLHGATTLDLAPGATVRGRTVDLSKEPGWEGPGRRRGLLGSIAAIFGFLGMLLIAPLVVLFFPVTAELTRQRILDRPWESLGKGFLMLILIPVGLVLLFVSVVGAPLGVASLPFLAAGWILAWSVAVFTAGVQLRFWLRRGRNQERAMSRREVFGWTALASLALGIVLWVPVLGFLFCLFLFVAAVGALGHRIVQRSA